jgi:hypothetical protein
MKSTTTAVTATFHFNDGSRLVLKWPKREDRDPATLASRLRQALDGNQLAFSVDGDLMIVPMRSVKYVHISPAPPVMPSLVVTDASIEPEGATFSIE